MKNSQFAVHLVLTAVAVVAAFFLARSVTPEPAADVRGTATMEAVETDAARALTQALIDELGITFGLTVQTRILNEARIRANIAVLDCRTSPAHARRVLDELDRIVNAANAAGRTQSRGSIQPAGRYDQSQYNPRRAPRQKLSEDDKLMRDLDRQRVPERLDDIGAILDNYSRAAQQADATDETW